MIEFYIPSEIEEGLTLNSTSSGYQDAVEALFIDDGVTSFEGSKDFFNLTTTAYPKTTNNFTSAIKMIIPEGFRLAMSLDTKTPARVCLGYTINGNIANCNYNFMGKIRAMGNKFPSILFTKFRQAIYIGRIVISID